MYASIYIHRVPRAKIDAFLRVNRAAADIYRELGALDAEIFRGVDLTLKYGCASFRDALALPDNECLLVGIDRFRDPAHHKEAMARIDSDQRIAKLHDEITGLIDIARVVRGEFERTS